MVIVCVAGVDKLTVKTACVAPLPTGTVTSEMVAAGMTCAASTSRIVPTAQGCLIVPLEALARQRLNVWLGRLPIGTPATGTETVCELWPGLMVNVPHVGV